MKTVFIHFNPDGTVKDAAIRYGNKKTDHDRWECWDMYQLLLTLGRKPIKMAGPGEGYTHMLVF